MENTFYNFDINMTESCTLRCSYCIENFNKKSFKEVDSKFVDQLIDKFNYLLSSEKFLSRYNGIRISFWGGEPTTNFKNLKKITDYYKNNNKVIFFMYSNGYDYKHIYDYLEEFKNIKIGDSFKFLTQISYDGIASHDVDRLTLNGKGSALKVKETIFELARRNIPFTVHPTIASKNFDKIALNYFEFLRMSDVLGFELNYSPTIDYMSKYDFTEEELNKIVDILKKEFLKIKDEEINFFKNKGYFRFGWMNPNRAICTAGDGYSGINLDGNLYPCHGVFNEPSISEKLITNKLENDNDKFLNNLIESSSDFNTILNQPLPENCQNCVAHYCLKCNSTKCSNSKDNDINSAWVDYTNQPSLCYIYKFIGKYRIALMKYINQDNK